MLKTIGVALLMGLITLGVQIYMRYQEPVEDQLLVYNPTPFTDRAGIYSATFPNKPRREGNYDISRADGTLAASGKRFCGYSLQLISCVVALDFTEPGRPIIESMGKYARAIPPFVEHPPVKQVYFPGYYQDRDAEVINKLTIESETSRHFKAFGFGGGRVKAMAEIEGTSYPAMVTVLTRELTVVIIMLVDLANSGWKSEAATTFNSSFQIITQPAAEH